MVTASKRVQFLVGEDSLENHVGAVLRSLNGEWGSGNEEVASAYRRRALIVLIRRIQQVEATARDFGSKFTRVHQGDFRAAEEIGSPVFLKYQSRLDRFLSRFAARPHIQLQPVMDSGGQSAKVFWELSWMALRESRFWYEPSLLNEVIQVAKSGSINALRQCDQCLRWMFARRPVIDRFCTPSCRDLFHRTNESDKKRRRDWARQNYQSRKELQLGSRKAAARKKRGKR